MPKYSGSRLIAPSLALLLGFLPLFAQTGKPDKTEGTAPLAWGEHAEHPIKALVDSAPVLTQDGINTFRLSRMRWNQVQELINPANPANRKAYFNGNYIPAAKLPSILRHPALAKYIRSFEQARNEFERKRVESSIKEDFMEKRKEFHVASHFVVFVDVALGDYDFNRKGFPVQRAGASMYRHEAFDLMEIPNWPSLPLLLPMSEVEAERFVSANPRRAVTMLAVMERDSIQTQSDDAAALTEKMKAQVMLSAFIGNPADGRRPVLATFPTEAGFSGILTARLDSILAAINEQRKPVAHAPEPEPDKICGVSSNPNTYDYLTGMTEKMEKLGFKASGNILTPGRKAALEKAISERAAFIKGILKIGKPYQGIQTYPNGVTKKMTITFNERSQDGAIYFGTCTYSNKKKAVVWAGQANCPHGPCLYIDFYEPTDDEPGHSDDFNAFHVLGKDWAVGSGMGESVNYNSPELPTRISLR